jgi:hypothetical protein
MKSSRSFRISWFWTTPLKKASLCTLNRYICFLFLSRPLLATHLVGPWFLLISIQTKRLMALCKYVRVLILFPSHYRRCCCYLGMWGYSDLAQSTTRQRLVLFMVFLLSVLPKKCFVSPKKFFSWRCKSFRDDGTGKWQLKYLRYFVFYIYSTCTSWKFYILWYIKKSCLTSTTQSTEGNVRKSDVWQKKWHRRCDREVWPVVSAVSVPTDGLDGYKPASL